MYLYTYLFLWNRFTSDSHSWLDYISTPMMVFLAPHTACAVTGEFHMGTKWFGVDEMFLLVSAGLLAGNSPLVSLEFGDKWCPTFTLGCRCLSLGWPLVECARLALKRGVASVSQEARVFVLLQTAWFVFGPSFQELAGSGAVILLYVLHLAVILLMTEGSH